MTLLLLALSLPPPVCSLHHTYWDAWQGFIWAPSVTVDYICLCLIWRKMPWAEPKATRDSFIKLLFRPFSIPTSHHFWINWWAWLNVTAAFEETVAASLLRNLLTVEGTRVLSWNL
jgi:hypothetical protein